MRRRASLRRFVTALLLIGLLTACGSHQTDRPDARTGLTVGATADAGSMVLANLYAAALRYFGSAAQVEVVADPLAALDSGQLDVVPGFTGRLLQTFAPGTSSGYGDEQVYKTLLGTLPEGITAGDYTTAAEDKPAAAVTGPTVAAWGGRDLTELVGHCGQVRPGTVRGVTVPTRVGTCKLPEPIEFDDSAALFAALKSNRINVAWTSTADPAVPEDSDGPQGTVLLADHKHIPFFIYSKPMTITAQFPDAVGLYAGNQVAVSAALTSVMYLCAVAVGTFTRPSHPVTGLRPGTRQQELTDLLDEHLRSLATLQVGNPPEFVAVQADNALAAARSAPARFEAPSAPRSRSAALWAWSITSNSGIAAACHLIFPGTPACLNSTSFFSMVCRCAA